MLRLPNAYFLFGAALAAKILIFSSGVSSVLGQQDDPFLKSKPVTSDPFSATKKDTPAPSDPFAPNLPSGAQQATPAEIPFSTKEDVNQPPNNAASDRPLANPFGSLQSQENAPALGKPTSESNLPNGPDAIQRSSSTPPLPTNLDEVNVGENLSGNTSNESGGIPELFSGRANERVFSEAWDWVLNNWRWLLPILVLLLIPVWLIFRRSRSRGRRRYSRSDHSDDKVNVDENVRKGSFKKSSRFSDAGPVDERALVLTAPENDTQDLGSFDFLEDLSADSFESVELGNESSLNTDDDAFDLGLDESYSPSKHAPSETPRQSSSDDSVEFSLDDLEDDVVRQDQIADDFPAAKASDVTEPASGAASAPEIATQANEMGTARPQSALLTQGNSKAQRIKNQVAEIAKLSSELQLFNEASERKVEDLESKLQQISQEKAQFTKDAEALRQQLTEANEKTAELDSKLADATVQLGARKQSDEEAAKKAADAVKHQEQADAKVEELNAELETLKGKLAESSQAETELARQLKTATAAAEQAESELVTAKEDVKLLQEEQQTRATALEKNRQEENREVESLNAQIDELKTELKDAQTASALARKELDDAKEQTEQQKKENDKTSVKFEEQKSAQSRAFEELQEELGALKIQIKEGAKEKTKLSSKLDEAVSASQKAEADRSQAQADVTKAQDELAKVQSDLVEAQDKLTESQTDLTKAQEDLTESQADLTKTQAKLAEAEANLSEVQGDLTSAKERLSEEQKAKGEIAAALEQQKHDQQKIVEDLNSQISSVKTDSTVDAVASTVKPTDLKRAAKKLKREITVRKQTEKWLAQAEEQRTDIARDLQAVREELKKAKEQLSQQSSQNNSTDVVEENASLKKQLAESAQRQNALEQQLEKANHLNKQNRGSDQSLEANRKPVSQAKPGKDEWSQKLQEVQEELVTKKKP